jgi:hypothetical protein
MSTTNTGVPAVTDTGADTIVDEIDGEGAFAKLWNEDAETPSDTKADDEDETEGSEDETETEGEDGDDKSTDDAEEEGSDDDAEGDDDNEANVVVKDDYKVKVKVGDEEKEFSIGSLKRLAGQEASLTQKSQEVASRRKDLDNQAATQVAVLDRLLAAAQKKLEPYQNVNLLALAKDPNISAEELTAIQEAYNSAQSDVRFLTQELGSFQQELQKQRSAELRAQAAETVKALSDPDKGIPGFGEKMYGDMMSFAQSQGVAPEALSEIVDVTSLRILHMAMMYQRGQKTVKEETDPKAVAAKKQKTQKVPKKIVKSISNSESNREVITGGKSERHKTAVARLRRDGSDEAAMDAFSAVFEGGED